MKVSYCTRTLSPNLNIPLDVGGSLRTVYTISSDEASLSDTFSSEAVMTSLVPALSVKEGVLSSRVGLAFTSMT